jgi:hypothetical protein
MHEEFKKGSRKGAKAPSIAIGNRSILSRLCAFAPLREVRTALAMACALAFAGNVGAQTIGAPEPSTEAVRSAELRPISDSLPLLSRTNAIIDPQVRQASGCSSCGMGPRGDANFYGPPNLLCVPGQRGCNPGCDDTHFGRLLNGFYVGLCCPDPCYEPMWIPAANAAFFQDSPRPVTQTRFRWDRGIDYRFPDSAEYFWAQIGTKGPKNPTPGVRYNELRIYQEIAASPGASAFFDFSYRSLDSGTNPSEAGMGDVIAGAKTVVLDRELLLVSTQFTTYILAGNPTTGLGTGHVSLEPALLAALKLTPSTYLQTELAYWIPLGGTSGFQGSTFHYHFSLNQNLCRHGDFLNIVGTVELNGYSFRGRFTDFPSGIVTDLGGRGYVNIGPGLRIQFCDRLDVGLGAAFGITEDHGPRELYRTEIRLRF